MTNTLPTIALRCAYIRAGNGTLLCAVPLTLISEQDMTDGELTALAERRVEAAAYDLRFENSTVQTEIRVGVVATKNPAFKFPAADDYND